MAVTKLTLFNSALRHLEDRPLASLSENRESRRILDAAWDNGAVDFCLESGQWKFAMRSIQLDASPSIAPDFGYEYGFDKPEDHVRTAGVFSDERMTQPFEDHREEAGYWFGSLETMYIRYVSNDASYGMDYSLWPQSFTKFVVAHIAAEAKGPLTEKGQELIKLQRFYLNEALSKDAMADPTKSPPVGSWVRARGRMMSRDGQP